VKRLRRFEKIELAPNETKSIQFELQAADLSFIGLDNQWIVEAGRFEVLIGGLNHYFSINK
jgi:beta-glucosidase